MIGNADSGALAIAAIGVLAHNLVKAREDRR